jgi:hypothetical protein
MVGPAVVPPWLLGIVQPRAWQRRALFHLQEAGSGEVLPLVQTLLSASIPVHGTVATL